MPTLDLRTKRGELTAARARELLAEVLGGRRVDYDRIVLSDYAWTAEAADVVAQAMLKLPLLTDAVLADIIASKPEAEGLAVYRAIGVALRTKRLRLVDLSDNAVGTKGIEACRDFLSGQDGLEEVTFSNCGLSAEACRSVADLLLFRTPTRLSLLHFNNNMSGSGGGIAIADVVKGSSYLRDLRFSSSRCGVDGALAFAAALPCAPELRRIDLSDNTFNARGLAALSSAISSLSVLEELNLGDTAAGNVGMAALAAALVGGACSRTLRVLNVSSNELSGKGARSIARCVRRLEVLEALDASGNELGPAGARVLARAFGQRSTRRHVATLVSCDPLASIVLEGNEIGTSAAVVVARAASEALPALASLRLAENGISADGVAALRAALASAGKSTVLDHFEPDDDADDEDDDEGAEDEGDDGDSDVEAQAPATTGGAASSTSTGAADADADVSRLAALLELKVEL